MDILNGSHLNAELNDEPTTKAIQHIILSIITWTSFYKAQELIWPKKSAEFRCRIVSFWHGAIVTALAYYSQIVEGPSIFLIEPGLPNNNSQMFIAKVCLGYFFFDVAWCLYHQTEPMIMIIHHILSIFGMLNMVLQGKWGTELIGVIGGTEITNPLLQTRWFLKQFHFNKQLAVIVDFLFIFVFGYFRLYLGGFVLIHYVSFPKWDFLGKLGAVTMYGLSSVFYFYILRYAIRKYVGFSARIKVVSSNGVQKEKCHDQSNGHKSSSDNHSKED